MTRTVKVTTDLQERVLPSSKLPLPMLLPTIREKTTREEIQKKKIKRRTATTTDMRTEWARRARH